MAGEDMQILILAKATLYGQKSCTQFFSQAEYHFTQNSMHR